MRVLMTSQALTPWHGGSAVSESSLASHLSNYCEITVLCPRGSLDYAFAKSNGVRSIVEYDPREVFDVWSGKRNWFSDELARCDIFHINGHWRWENYLFARLCVARKVPYLLHPRGMCLVGHRRVLVKRAFNLALGNYIVSHAARVIALSKFEIDQFRPYHLRQGQVEVIPNGIVSNTKRSHLPPVKLVRDGRYFLYLGRIESRKGLTFLLKVYSNYLRAGGSARLVMAGPVERGHDRELRKLCAQLGVLSSVEFLAPVYGAEKDELLTRAIAVVYPSHQEPFGRVPFEAIAVGGVPIIPDRSGSAEYLRSVLPSSIYQHEDAASLLGVMQAIEARDKETTAAQLERAQTFVRHELNWERIAARVFDTYVALTSSPVENATRETIAAASLG